MMTTTHTAALAAQLDRTTQLDTAGPAPAARTKSIYLPLTTAGRSMGSDPQPRRCAAHPRSASPPPTASSSATQAAADDGTACCTRLETRSGDYLGNLRPTAVNLFWALDRMQRAAPRVAARRRGPS